MIGYLESMSRRGKRLKHYKVYKSGKGRGSHQRRLQEEANEVGQKSGMLGILEGKGSVCFEKEL